MMHEMKTAALFNDFDEQLFFLEFMVKPKRTTTRLRLYELKLRNMPEFAEIFVQPIISQSPYTCGPFFNCYLIFIELIQQYKKHSNKNVKLHSAVLLLLLVVKGFLPTFYRLYVGKPMFGQYWYETLLICLLIVNNFSLYFLNVFTMKVGQKDLGQKSYLLN